MTEAEKTRLSQLRVQIDAEKDDIVAEGQRKKTAHDLSITRLREVMQILKEVRTRQGLSLAEIQDRTGIAKSALSRLETDSQANPTLTTITRYAEALGKDLQIVIANRM